MSSYLTCVYMCLYDWIIVKSSLLFISLLIAISYGTVNDTVVVNLQPLVAQQPVISKKIATTTVDSSSLQRYRKRIQRIFPKGHRINKKSFRRLQYQLAKVKNSPSKVNILFHTFRENLFFDTLSTDSTLESQFIKSWVRAAKSEQQEFIRQAYSEYFPDRFRYGSSIVVGTDYEEINKGDTLSIIGNVSHRYEKYKEIKEFTVSYTLSRMEFDNTLQSGTFKKIKTEELHFSESLFVLVDTFNRGGVYKLTFSNDTYFTEKYLSVHSLSAKVKQDNSSFALIPSVQSKETKLILKKEGRFSLYSADSYGNVHGFMGAGFNREDVTFLLESDGELLFLEGALNYPDMVDIKHTSAYLYSDRPLYKPGDTLYFGGIIRDLVNETYLTKPSLDSIRITVSAGRKNLFNRYIKLNEFGHISSSIVLPENLESEYVEIDIADREELEFPLMTSFNGIGVTVKKFAKPAFKVNLSTDKSLYSQDDSIEVSVKSSYVFGKPLAYATVDLSFARKGTIFWRESKLISDESGVLTFKLPVKELRADGSINCKAYVSSRWKKGTILQTIPLTIEKKDVVKGTAKPVPTSPKAVPVSIEFDKYEYHFGDTAKVLISCDTLADQLDVWVEGNDLKYFARAEKSRIFSIEIPVNRTDGYNTFVHVTRTANSRIKKQFKQIPIAPDMTLMCEVTVTGPDEKRPGEHYSADFRIQNRAGEPLLGEFSLAVVDEALYSFKGDNDMGVSFLLPQSDYFKNRVYKLYVEDVGDNFRSLLKELISPGILGEKSKTRFLIRSSQSGFYTKERKFFSLCSLCGDDHRTTTRVKRRKANRVRSTGMKSAGMFLRRRASQRSKFKDVAFYASSVKTDSEGKASVSFNLPDNITQWRMTLRGSDGGENLIHKKEFFYARLPFVSRLVAPGFFTEGDFVNIAVEVHNYTDSIQEGIVHCGIGGEAYGTDLLDSSARFSINPGEVIQVPFPVSVKTKDSLYVDVMVTSDAHSDGFKRALPVNNSERRHRLYEKAKGNDTIQFILPHNAYNKNRSIDISLFPHESYKVVHGLDYLMNYPHGCVEQTLHMFLPSIAVSNFKDKLSLRNRTLEKKFHTVTEIGLKKLEEYQHDDGLWGWWDYDATNLKMSSLVLDGLSFLQKSKITPKQMERVNRMYEKAVDSASVLLKKVGPNHAYWLSLVSTLPKSKIGQFEEELDSYFSNRELPNLYEQSLLLTSFIKLEKHDKIDSLKKKLLSKIVLSDSGAFWNSGDCYQLIHWHCDRETVTATILRTLLEADDKNPLYDEVVRWLYSQYDGHKWRNTKTSGAVIRALSKYYELKETTYFARLNSEVSINGKDVPIQATMDGVLFHSESLDSVTSDTILISMKGVENSTEWSVHCNYATPFDILPQNGALSIQRSTSLKGLQRGRIGDVITVNVQLTCDRDLDYIMLEDYIPAGAKIISSQSSNLINHKVESLDKMVYYIEKLPKGTHILHYRYRLEHAGYYTIPPARAELMYQPDLYWESEPSTMVIK